LALHLELSLKKHVKNQTWQLVSPLNLKQLSDVPEKLLITIRQSHGTLP